MNKEDKELLLIDLCARLPYGVKIHIGKTQRIEVFGDINLRIGSINNTYADVKPYLFPLSSMAEEQKAELNKLTYGSVAVNKDYFYDLCNCSKISTNEVINIVDWLNKNHFDYRGLIKKGLAIDATGLNIY